MYHVADNQLLSSPLLEQMPGWMFVKNMELQYTSTTLKSALLCGFKNQHDKYGRTDYELKCKASESAVFFQEQDRQVMSEAKDFSFLQLNQYFDNKTHVFLTKKTPLKGSCGKIIGLCGITEEITNPTIANAIIELANIGKIDPNLGLNKKNFEIDSGFFKALSQKELEIIFYFMRELSSKEISTAMCLSFQEINTALDNLKNKFKCSTLQDLYSYCLTYDAHKKIPQTLLTQCINKNSTMSFVSTNKKDIKVSRRQQECIKLLLIGATSFEIAQKLNLSARTIETYIDLLKSKFYARNRTELIVKLCQYYPN